MLSLYNLNIMHGRNSKNAIIPPFFGRKRIQDNLKKIADNIKENNPDIVTLQEIDQGSILSGSFDQFDWLNSNLNYSYKYFAPSCSITFFGKKMFVSGNAIFSRYPLEQCKSHIFDFTFPTDRMGFVSADVKLPNNKLVTVISAHLVYLDWIRHNPRLQELDVIKKVINEKRNSFIISGDLNCDYVGRESSVRDFVKQLNLKVYDSSSRDLSTYPSWNPTKRIDWILASKDLEFYSYKVVKEKISDHLGVIAVVQ
jgi:endonuclease/exonuclease/phosphatase family metal-dependent hydrolase